MRKGRYRYSTSSAAIMKGKGTQRTCRNKDSRCGAREGRTKEPKKQDLVSSKELIIGGQGENGSHECSGNHLVGRASVLRRTSFRSRRVVQYQIYLWDGIWGAIGSSVESSRSIQASVVFIHSPNIRCRSFVHSYIHSFV